MRKYLQFFYLLIIYLFSISICFAENKSFFIWQENVEALNKIRAKVEERETETSKKYKKDLEVKKQTDEYKNEVAPSKYKLPIIEKIMEDSNSDYDVGDIIMENIFIGGNKYIYYKPTDNTTGHFYIGENITKDNNYKIGIKYYTKKDYELLTDSACSWISKKNQQESKSSIIANSSYSKNSYINNSHTNNSYTNNSYSYSISPSHEYVKGYYRKDGTYVKPHYRTHSNETKNDNWSNKGNYNPYTGKKGYRKK